MNKWPNVPEPFILAFQFNERLSTFYKTKTHKSPKIMSILPNCLFIDFKAWLVFHRLSFL